MSVSGSRNGSRTYLIGMWRWYYPRNAAGDRQPQCLNGPKPFIHDMQSAHRFSQRRIRSIRKQFGKAGGAPWNPNDLPGT